VPNLNWLSGLHSAYTGKVYSDNAPQDNLIINIKGMPQVSNFDDEIKQGFSNLSMQISDNGMTSTIEYNTKKIKSISKDLIKFFNTRRFLTKAK
jgi:hypothetical protein